MGRKQMDTERDEARINRWLGLLGMLGSVMAMAMVMVIDQRLSTLRLRLRLRLPMCLARVTN